MCAIILLAAIFPNYGELARKNVISFPRENEATGEMKRVAIMVRS